VRNVPREALAAAATVADDPRARRVLARYIERTEGFRMPLNGADLMALGVPEGPEMGRLLRLLRDSALDGTVRTRQSAIAFVEQTHGQALGR
ncbi:MAG: hypothetical protein WD533_08330, partial [Dehalococcoidia bacterium]